MMKCVVVSDAATLVVGKDSIVYVSERQYELARAHLKPLKEDSEEVIKEKKSRKKAE